MHCIYTVLFFVIFNLRSPKAGCLWIVKGLRIKFIKAELVITMIFCAKANARAFCYYYYQLSGVRIYKITESFLHLK